MSFQHNFSLSVQMVHLTYSHVTSAYTKMLIPWYFDNECLYVSYDEQHYFISYFNNKSDKTSLSVSLSALSRIISRVCTWLLSLQHFNDDDKSKRTKKQATT